MVILLLGKGNGAQLLRDEILHCSLFGREIDEQRYIITFGSCVTSQELQAACTKLYTQQHFVSFPKSSDLQIKLIWRTLRKW